MPLSIEKQQIPSAIHQSWYPTIGKYFIDERFKKILAVLRQQIISKKTICPDMRQVFRAFSLPLYEVRVIIVGTAPYQRLDNNKRYATGLAFGVPNNTYETKALRIIRDALAYQYCEIAIEEYFDYTLKNWHNQGVMLLNRVLTVPANATNPKEHWKMWENFIIDVVKAISYNTSGIVWGLLGEEAKDLIKFIDPLKHYVVEGTDPAYTYDQLVNNAWNENKIDHFKHEDFFLNIDKHTVDINNEVIKWVNY